MVAASVFGHVPQMLGPGQLLEHLDGRHDVLVDGRALGRSQGAGSNRQILQLVGRQERGLYAVNVAPDMLAGDRTHTRQRHLAHGFAADVGGTQEFAVGLQRRNNGPGVGRKVSLGLRINTGAQRQLLAQGLQFRIALEHFKAGVNQIDPVKQGLQFGGFVDHVHRCGNLAAIMQQAGNLEFVAVPVIHFEAGQRTLNRFSNRLGQHHGQCWHPLAMSAGVRRFFVNGQVDHIDEGFKQFLKLRHQQPVTQGDRCLRGQGLGQTLIGQGKRHHLLAAGCLRIDELQHADHLTLVILHGHRQERLGAIASTLIKATRPGKIEIRFAVGVGDIDRLHVNRRIACHQRVIRSACRIVQRQIRKADGAARSPAHGDIQ